MRTNELQESDNSTVGFLLLWAYSIAIFIRPQEWQFSLDPLPLARYFLIFAFVFYLLFSWPKKLGYQGWFLLGIFTLIPLSGVRNGWFGGGVYQGIDFMIYSFLPFLLYSSLVNTRKRQHAIFWIFIIASYIILHHGISQKLSPEGIGWSGYALSQGTRITYLGIFNDPNDLSMFLVMNIPILLYFRSISESFLMRAFYLLSVFFLMFGIYLSNSRGALVGILALLFTYSFLQYGKIKTVVITLFSLPLVYLGLTMFRTIDSEEASAYGRIEAWYEAIQMFKMRPLFGVGKGNFMDHHIKTAHNSFLLIVAELGALGYILWFVTIALTMWMLFSIMNINTEKYKEKLADIELLQDIKLAKAMFYSLIGFLTTAFFLSRSYIVFLYVFLGLSFAVYNRVEHKLPHLKESYNGKVITNLFLLAPATMIMLWLITVILL